ncbi:cation diffusion facilitator family transporter [Halonatronum saccharophilum]|uniref:cation diffusion facilitator family transporter n=1 Tax=Halonatronum saccharophilum TaxID=150060 RepID=UPI0004B5F160|nr:cation diffusion facilitator family transporter [Halonatronum saccharophilum]
MAGWLIQNNKTETNLLKVSIYSALFFSITSFLLGIILNSQLLVFDGLYSLISVFLSYLSLVAIKFIKKTDYELFPFGKSVIEPLVIIIKYFLIILLVISSLVTAIMSILEGGRDVVLGPALIYTIFGVIGCFVTYKYLYGGGKSLNSNIVISEANQWYMDTLVSLGVLVGFFIAVISQLIDQLNPIIPYIDPIMVILFSVYFIKIPIEEIISSIKELLQMAPDDDLRTKVEKEVLKLKEEYNIDNVFIRVTKVGRTLKIDVDFIVGKDSYIRSITDQDEIRGQLYKKLKKNQLELWMDIAFTQDEKWAI